MKRENIQKVCKINDGIFVSGGHPSDDQNIVQEIVTKCMFYLGSIEVDYADILDGRCVRKQTEVNNA